jgi:hypothetical protein
MRTLRKSWARGLCDQGKHPTSFEQAASLMAAAEIAKLRLPGYPFSANRVALYTASAAVHTAAAPMGSRRDGCACLTRSASVHQAMSRVRSTPLWAESLIQRTIGPFFYQAAAGTWRRLSKTLSLLVSNRCPGPRCAIELSQGLKS